MNHAAYITKATGATIVGLLLTCACLGCASLAPSPPAPSIAETDTTLSAPMRPSSGKQYEWWEFGNILDPRSRDIEKHLGY